MKCSECGVHERHGHLLGCAQARRPAESERWRAGVEAIAQLARRLLRVFRDVR